MFLWIESHATATITVLAFALSYAIAAIIFILAELVAGRRLAADLKATSPVMLTPLSVVAGLLIAFLASHVWTNLDHANAYVAEEASAIRETVLLAEALPGETRVSLRKAIKDYLQFIETEDWPAMLQNRASLRRLPTGLTEAMAVLLSFAPAGPSQQLAQQRAVAAIERALEARRNRINLSQAVIAPLQWAVILVLGALVLLVVAMVHIDRRVTAAANLLIFATALAVCLALLMINDRPFAAGGNTIEPIALRQIAIE